MLFQEGQTALIVEALHKSGKPAFCGLLLVASIVGATMIGGGGALRAKAAPESRMASLFFVVLPFANASGDPHKEYIAANITSDLTAGLSGITDSLVIAHSSAGAMASQPLSEISRRFGITYAVRGSTSADGVRVKLTVMLLRAESEEQLWSERFEDDLAALSTLEREIIAGIARRLGVTFADVGLPRPPLSAQDLPALDSLLRAQVAAEMPATAQTIAQAQGLFAMAARSPRLAAEAKAGLAAVHLLSALSRGSASARDLAECDLLVHEALAADSRNSRALNTLGALLRATGRPREALGAYEAAAVVNRNDANALGQIGRLKIEIGEPAQALSQIELALRLSPLDSQRALWLSYAGLALLYMGDAAGARPWLEKSVAAAPQFVTALVFLAAAQQLDGRNEEARRTIAAVQRVNPTLSVARVDQQFAPAEGGRAEWLRIRDSLRQAGLPN